VIVQHAEPGTTRDAPPEELFELEMKHIFEGNWIYLAH
jgi:phenylpropionate dioxygenase-like ring-hydroxylating dioxygenase large terminal subunit